LRKNRLIWCYFLVFDFPFPLLLPLIVALHTAYGLAGTTMNLLFVLLHLQVKEGVDQVPDLEHQGAAQVGQVEQHLAEPVVLAHKVEQDQMEPAVLAYKVDWTVEATADIMATTATTR
jgi:hypothetical protein